MSPRFKEEGNWNRTQQLPWDWDFVRKPPRVNGYGGAPPPPSTHAVRTGCAGTVELWESGQFSDFTILAGERQFKVHRAILATASQYFQRMLVETPERPAFIEATSRVLRWGESEECVKQFLKMVYDSTYVPSAQGLDTAVEVFRLCHTLDEKGLMDRARAAVIATSWENQAGDQVLAAYEAAVGWEDKQLIQAISCQLAGLFESRQLAAEEKAGLPYLSPYYWAQGHKDLNQYSESRDGNGPEYVNLSISPPSDLSGMERGIAFEQELQDWFLPDNQPLSTIRRNALVPHLCPSALFYRDTY